MCITKCLHVTVCSDLAKWIQSAVGCLEHGLRQHRGRGRWRKRNEWLRSWCLSTPTLYLTTNTPACCAHEDQILKRKSAYSFVIVSDRPRMTNKCLRRIQTDIKLSPKLKGRKSFDCRYITKDVKEWQSIWP